jgi:hypothetical protein
MRVETSHFEIFLRERGRCRACATTVKGHQVDCQLHMVQDGAQVLQRIDKLDTELKRPRSTERYSRTPVVLMTSHDSNALRQTAARHATPVYFKKTNNLR